MMYRVEAGERKLMLSMLPDPFPPARVRSADPFVVSVETKRLIVPDDTFRSSQKNCVPVAAARVPELIDPWPSLQAAEDRPCSVATVATPLRNWIASLFADGVAAGLKMKNRLMAFVAANVGVVTFDDEFNASDRSPSNGAGAVL